MRKCLIAFMALALSACTWMHPDEIVPEDNLVNVGDSLPTFTLCMCDGSILSTADLIGKPSLIVFFSTDCPDCEQVLSDLDRRFLAYSDDTSYVAIAREQTSQTVSSYWTAAGFSLPFSAQTDRLIYNLFARKGIPRIYISDSAGIVERALLPAE